MFLRTVTALILAASLAGSAVAQVQPAPAAPGFVKLAPPPTNVKPITPVNPATAMKSVIALPVNINTASAAELDKLPQVGPARVAKIIAGRPWKDPRDLVAKKVIPQSLYDANLAGKIIAK